MLFPIGDDNSDRRTTPFVNYLLIAANILVFVFLQGMGANARFTYAYSTVPEEILTRTRYRHKDRVVTDPASGDEFRVPGLQRTPIPVFLTLLTSMFMHGGIAHILGNMLYLWIFGDNVEDAVGHGRYLLFYLIVGIIASLSSCILHVGLRWRRIGTESRSVRRHLRRPCRLSCALPAKAGPRSLLPVRPASPRPCCHRALVPFPAHQRHRHARPGVSGRRGSLRRPHRGVHCRTGADQAVCRRGSAAEGNPGLTLAPVPKCFNSGPVKNQGWVLTGNMSGRQGLCSVQQAGRPDTL